MDGKKLGRRSWTTLEERYLREQAGLISIEDLCAALGRSESSIRSKVTQMRKNGESISLAYFESSLVWCPQCATWRTKLFKRSGLCPVCRLQERLEKNERKCDEALTCLASSQRQNYIRSLQYLGSDFPPKPIRCKYSQKTRFQQVKSDDDYLVAVESWESACLKKRINAAKTRLMRIREKTGSNPLKGADQKDRCGDRQAGRSAQTVTPHENCL